VSDEYDGLGGSYVVDPETGRRVLVGRTQPAEDQPLKEQEDGTAEA